MATHYTIGDASRELNIPASTIRFYDKRGLIPGLARTYSGMRVFDEDGLEWLRFIERLKASGMPLKEIKEYVDLFRQGQSTILQRQRIVEARRAEVERQLAELETTRDFISYKCWYYEQAEKLGSEQAVRDLPESALPEWVKSVKDRCKITRY